MKLVRIIFNDVPVWWRHSCLGHLQNNDIAFCLKIEDDEFITVLCKFGIGKIDAFNVKFLPEIK